MRELKFRAWNGKQMLDEFGFYHDSFGTFPKVNEGFKHLASLPKGELDFPFIVMQFTGLLDRDGIEIYDGDILDSETEAVGNWEVQWHDKWGKWIIWAKKTGYNHGVWNSIQKAPRLKIVGNIYQNPELLK